jgi:prophage maintenance system killer protein
MLSVADLQLVNTVAARRFGGVDKPDVDVERLTAAVSDQRAADTAFRRAAALVGTLLRESVFATAPLPTALLSLHCALSLDGIVLLAPQGVVAGMIKGIAAGDDPAVLARWLEDRAVPSGGG